MQMDLFLLLIIVALFQLVSSQQDNDGNDVDNDQDLTIRAFGNVITPIKGKNLSNLLHVVELSMRFSKCVAKVFPIRAEKICKRNRSN